MTPTELGVFETQKIADAFSKILGQMEIPKNLNDLTNKLTKLTEEQTGVYKKAAGFFEGHRKDTAETLDKGLGKLTQDQTQAREILADANKQFERNAPGEIQQRYQKLTSPTSSSSAHK